MSGKRVHFIDANPATPSPSYSVSSLASSPGPITPPGVYPLLPPVGGVYQVHPLLLSAASKNTFRYDVSLPHSSIEANISTHVLRQAATEPPVPYMELRSPYLGWVIKVSPSHGTIITVEDVFKAIHSTLRVPMAPAEYNLIPRREQRDSVDAAYRARCMALGDPHAIQAELQRGIRRVDGLAGHTMFVGISPTKGGGHIWTLFTARAW